MRQLFGVRWPGSALAGRDLSRPRLLELIQRSGRPVAADHSGARPPHSKELKALASIRKRLARFRNSDPVVGELEMRAGKLNLGHVTGDTQAASDRTRFVGAAQLFFSFRNRR